MTRGLLWESLDAPARRCCRAHPLGGPPWGGYGCSEGSRKRLVGGGWRLVPGTARILASGARPRPGPGRPAQQQACRSNLSFAWQGSARAARAFPVWLPMAACRRLGRDEGADCDVKQSSGLIIRRPWVRVPPPHHDSSLTCGNVLQGALVCEVGPNRENPLLTSLGPCVAEPHVERPGSLTCGDASDQGIGWLTRRPLSGLNSRSRGRTRDAGCRQRFRDPIACGPPGRMDPVRARGWLPRAPPDVLGLQTGKTPRTAARLGAGARWFRRRGWLERFEREVVGSVRAGSGRGGRLCNAMLPMW